MSKSQSDLLDFIDLVVAGDVDRVSRCLMDNPALAIVQAKAGATRQYAADFFFPEISRYLYAGERRFI